jgi:hypothetical protein
MRTACIWGYEEIAGTGAMQLAGPSQPITEVLSQFRKYKAGEALPGGLRMAEIWESDQGITARVIQAQNTGGAKHEVKRTMKKIIGLFFAVTIGLLLSQSAVAQYVTGTYTHGGTNVWPALGSGTVGSTVMVGSNVFPYSTTLDIRKAKTISFQVKGTWAAAGTNISLQFVESIDGINWDTNTTPRVNIICPYAAAGVTAGWVTVSTNFDVGGTGYLRLWSVGPNYDADGTWTNHWIRYGYKIGAP